jgi:hypothetical protein
MNMCNLLVDESSFNAVAVGRNKCFLSEVYNQVAAAEFVQR